jgi:hypothetical protein
MRGERRGDRRLVGEVRNIWMVDERAKQRCRSNSSDGYSESRSRRRVHGVVSSRFRVGSPGQQLLTGVAGGRSAAFLNITLPGYHHLLIVAPRPARALWTDRSVRAR